MPYVALFVVGAWAFSKLVRTLIECGRSAARGVATLRRHVARRMSSPKDLSQFDISETLGRRRPNWARGGQREADRVLEPLYNLETPMFSGTKSRYARVSLADGEDAEELLS